MLVILVAVPVVAGAVVWGLGDRRAGARAVMAIGSLLVTLVVASAVAARRPTAEVRWGSGLTLRLEVHGVARGPVVLVAFVGLAVAVYALGYGERRGRSRMLALLVAFVGVMELLLVAGDWVTLLTAWELVGALSWALIAHHWRGDAPTSAAQAFVATRVGDLGLFVAAGATFAATGSLRFAALGEVSAGWATVVALGVVLAAMAKSAQLPFSPWLFSAMAGPTPASALLHSATMVAAGAYLLARLQPFLDTVSWFGPAATAIGLTTALAGGVVALVQPEAKKVLAASTSAHYGLMFVAVGAGFPAVAVAHLLAHGLFKALLFVSAGVAIDASGGERLGAMRLGRKLPAVTALTAIATLALAAVAPLGAAWTKEEIVAAAGAQAPWLAALVVLAGALSAGYAARFQLLAYGPLARTATSAGVHADDATDAGQVAGRRLAVVAMALLAVTTVLAGLLWLPFGEDRLTALVGAGLPGGEPWEVVASLAAVAAAIALAVVADRRGRLVAPWTGPGAERVAAWFALETAGRALVTDPTLVLARAAARFDDQVVDAGLRSIARGASALARVGARGDDRVVDAGVRGVTRLTTRLSSGLAGRDDRAVGAGIRGVSQISGWSGHLLTRLGEAGMDGTVEGLARLTGAAGRRSRRLQSGQSHQYYAGIAVGLVVFVAVAVLWR